MARLRLTIGGAVPVDPVRPPVVMGGSFTVSATASATNGLGRAALSIGGSLVAYAAQALSGAFTVSAGAKLKADLTGAFVISGTASGGPAAAAWPNGYLDRRRLVLAAQTDLAPETVTDFPYFIDSTEIPGDWSFLVTANGKLLTVTGGVPFDLRFETEAGVKLDHYIESFDGTAGTLRAFVRIPSWACATADFRILVYCGKAGDTDQRNIPGVWQGATFVIDTTTGADLTGHGRNFTPSNVTATTLDGRPAALFVGGSPTSFLRRTNADLTVFDTRSNITEEFWLKCAGGADGNISRLGGSPGSQQPNARFAIWTEAVGSTPAAKANVFEFGANWWDGAAQHNEYTESLANQADNSLRHMFVVYQQNTHTQLYDGETNISSTDFSVPNVLTPGGTIHPRTDDNYSLGAGTGAQTLAPAMTMGLYSIWPTAFSATRRALADRCQRDGSLVACLGGVDLVGDADHAPAGVVFRQAITAQTSIGFQGHAYDPDAGAAIVATAVTPASDATATYAIVGGQLQVTPVAGVTGTGRPVVTISDGTKTSKVSPVLAISSAGGGGGGSAQLAIWELAASLPASGAASRTNVATKPAIPATMASGRHYVVTADIALGGATVTIGGGGAAGSPSYLRGDTESGDQTTYRTISNGTINLVGLNHAIFRRLRFRDVTFVLGAGCSWLQFEANWFADQFGSYDGGVLLHNSNDAVDHILIAFNSYKATTGNKISLPLLRSHGPVTSVYLTTDYPLHDVRMYRNHIHAFTTGPSAVVSGGNSGRSRVLFIGDNARGANRPARITCDENLATQWDSVGPWAELKVADSLFRGNTFEQGTLVDPGNVVGGHNPLEIRFRHGRVTTNLATAIEAGHGHVNDGNLWITRPGYVPPGGAGIRCQDGFGVAVNNWACVLGGGLQPSPANFVLDGTFSIDLLTGTLDAANFPQNSVAGGGSNWPNTVKWKVGGNRATVNIGTDGRGPVHPTSNRVAPTTAGRGDRNHVVAPGTGVATDSSSTVHDAAGVAADYNTPPHRLRAAENGFAGTPEVGPAAWNSTYYR